ncbi:DegT/DnrJ/EryC1/StrS family aminotransferase [Puniceicoccales bacterium CK1056]|uniref:DegT/DnrJ/EryC1/StrS family aminotransferase n=1 Tax=Oceanipulchritudo coccoides TaxID=2706888 RepID=A0A6B2M354_9BACT|nr:DegT/DnrJ/EryC1/StrS family aminotransferase [Oceanipulchritudo coccoides]NDV62742.1 DegT/DnrJ/EryC1/StrS family aminotransferase [Oceanipulchritudo coccoides]
MPVPLLDLTRQHTPLEDEFKAVFERVFKSNAFVLGPDVKALEEEIASYCDCSHAVGLSSGTDALLVALMALGIGPGDEVLCPSFTFFGTAGSIARLGAVPVWVDVLPDTFNIDLADAIDKVTDKTKAIMPVHLYGQSAEMECVQAFARKFGVKIIEDVAQAIGATYGGRKVGSFGDFGALSFYPTKNLGGFGDGGMLVTNDAELAEKAVWLRNHGMNPKYYHKYIGGNFRLDSLQAALLRVKLPHLESYHTARRANAEAYTERLAGHSGVLCPRIIPKAQSVWNQYTLRILDGKRDAFREFLSDRGIGNDIYYPLGLHDQECFQGIGRGGESLTVTPMLAKEVVSIPCFPEMTVDEREEVLKAVWDFGYAK